MNKTKIEWCDYTWNPFTACSAVSELCKNCYAERISKRFGFPWGGPHLAKKSKEIIAPITHKKPSRIFVCSMSDIFHHDFTQDGQLRIEMSNDMAVDLTKKLMEHVKDKSISLHKHQEEPAEIANS